VTDELTFLPWLRTGLAQAVDVVDDATGSTLPGGAALTAYVDVDGERATRAVQLLGPEFVTGLAPAQVLREEPRAGSGDVEPNYFPSVELASPDLPWLLTPARAADATPGRLRPWLVLVVVREQDGVSIGPSPGTTLPALRIAAPAVPADELPDLAESWAWAHVQSLVPLDEIEAAVGGATGDVVARLVCPRRLVPGEAWLACVVPAFLGGVERGLGRTVVPGAARDPAWELASLGELVELPVYHHWRFTTGRAGDFEALCRRLKPDTGSAQLGRVPMDVTDPGLVSPARRRVLVSMEGALETPNAVSIVWDETHRGDFQDELIALLNAGPARVDWTPPLPGRPYDPATQDPVVAPPLYGAWPANQDSVPANGWVRTLNLHPVRRAAAGLGAAVVRADQEALVAAAWEQADQLRATVTALNTARLGAEVGRSLTRRATTRLPDAGLLQLTARLHAFLRVGATTVRAQLASSAVPTGLISAASLRQTRPGTALARDWARLRSPGARLGADHVERTLAATKGDATENAKAPLRFAEFGLVGGAQASDATLTGVSEPPLPDEVDAAIEAELDRVLGDRVRPTLRQRPQARIAAASRPPVLSSLDVSGLAGTVAGVLDPLVSIRADVLARIPALDDVLAEGSLPTTLALTPVFEDPLSDDLTRLGAAWMLPGVGKLERNRVRLVTVNTSFVGSFMVAANHELARELLWRGYPVDLGGTFFRRFWNYVDEPRSNDISDLRGWTREWTITQNMEADAGPSESTVIVVRGDLVRRYPAARYFLQEAALDGDEASPVEAAPAIDPIFLGSLDRDTVFFGFDLDEAAVRGDRENDVPGYFLAIEEQAGAPRLGLDRARPTHFERDPTSWDQASWGHLVTSQEALDALTHADALNERLTGLGELEDGIAWGRNAAHLARATWQRPFRMYIHADLLV
jgi:hypothetical protein